jgi:FkbM family methyltransferase
MKYPNQLEMDIKHKLRIGSATHKNILFFEPNYIYVDSFTNKSVIVDVGCGRDAELSRYFIGKYGLTAFVVDPTRKHKPALSEIKTNYGDQFNILNYALSASDGTIVFNESIAGESGSIVIDHVNVKHGETVTYEVPTICLGTLSQMIGSTNIDFIKIDIEGAEYDLINHISDTDIRPYHQIFIEFHHRAVKKYSKNDTLKAVQTIQKFGYEVFTLDDINYLFFRKT